MVNPQPLVVAVVPGTDVRYALESDPSRPSWLQGEVSQAQDVPVPIRGRAQTKAEALDRVSKNA